ncbi:MAG: (2Fe-2S)-binding protein [Lentisphaerae bacterium]|jgi:NAD(P)H-nitrite reductase large subunit|nr:(2Fe-2S)-binding protein [Lentisphaerota bacterium]MBT4823242.1 (2Fe-2S)-binding protein [Lentisphaerota bacterium]MBT5604802.1 (2Fe-2S)-binding protein [Lentisphaerota bacterium]MBT7053553.1 (2Fe-2S)-binding protein [Lentisphaerota bacterium]MBT7843390.1 (2Fe-2S)-binding protein [Lentisphaerota bacterium]
MEDLDTIICRCEEITLREVLEAIRQGATDVDAVKRMTRAGMGLCQGKTCGRLVARILARETGQSVADVRPVTARHPVRPVPARVLASCPLPVISKETE